MMTWKFWRDALERAVKTFAQSFVALMGAGGFGIIDAPWVSSLNVAALAAVLSVFTSIAGINIGPDGTPSVVTPAAT